jgi:DMSO/TMAO reductase YedYZ molybdopterin-dependent catalytic subunit
MLPPMAAPSRREFLSLVARAGAGAAFLANLPPWVRQAQAATRTPTMIERNAYPEHWETTVAALDGAANTPNERFFVRSHFGAPTIDEADWRLEVTGLVRTPLSLTLAELRAMTPSTQACVLECAGNGRGLFRLPNTAGTQWQRGAVGNAAWTGASLAALLARAGVAPEARHVWFECADAAPLETVPRFARSIPIEKAMADVLLAHTMNGALLPRLHGAPVRAIVPGWFGMASAKWVTRIRVEAAPSDNYFIARGYRYVAPGGDPATSPPIETLRIKSLITAPLAGARVRAGVLAVRGFAWAGLEGVDRVEVSADGGVTWQAASLGPAPGPAAWRAFAATVTLPPGDATLMARATDGFGNAQPLEAPPNAGGYGNNSVHQVVVHALA